jgi:transcriptional regulator with XRE-family HTH domain
MPRPNPTRVLGREKTLARRIRFEREGEGWTYEGLASRMAGVGCPIQPSALYKVEKGDPPRRITVDELVALGAVFKLSLDELLLPPEVVADRDLRQRLEAWRVARAGESEASDALTDYVTAHPELEDALEDLFTDEDRQALVEMTLAALRKMQAAGTLKGATIQDLERAHERMEARRGKHR